MSLTAMGLYDSCGIWMMLLKLIAVICCKACNPAEYEIEGECCPKCPPGRHVLKHCNHNSRTKCKVCTESTYTDVPNGLKACLICTVCDEGKGLRVKHECKYNSDALCEPLPGYYCIETHSGSCRKAREHSTCLPGQYIYQNGTSLIDTVCKDCAEETYSDVSFMHCVQHTDCESMGQITVTPGTRSSYAVCSPKRLHFIGIILILLIVILSVLLWRKKKENHSVEQSLLRNIQCTV